MRKCAHAPCRREIPEADAMRWAIGEGLHRGDLERLMSLSMGYCSAWCAQRAAETKRLEVVR